MKIATLCVSLLLQLGGTFEGGQNVQTGDHSVREED